MKLANFRTSTLNGSASALMNQIIELTSRVSIGESWRFLSTPEQGSPKTPILASHIRAIKSLINLDS